MRKVPQYAIKKVGELETLCIDYENAEIVFHLLKNVIGDSTQEEIGVVILNHKYEIIGWQKVAMGVNNKVIFDVKDIFKVAIPLEADRIILVHNHPSGDLIPSDDDWVVNAQIMKAGMFLDVPLEDSIILSEYNYYSCLEQDEERFKNCWKNSIDDIRM